MSALRVFEAHLGVWKSASVYSVFNGVLVTEIRLSVLLQVFLLYETEALGLADPPGGASCALRLSELLFDLSPQQTLVLGLPVVAFCRGECDADWLLSSEM